MAKKGQFKSGAKKRSIRQRKYNSTPLQKKRRAIRNRARREATKNGSASKGDGKDVHHHNRKSLSGKTSVISASKNRSINSPILRRRRKKKR